MNGGILNRALEGVESGRPQLPEETSTLKAEVLRAEWLRLEYTQDFKKTIEHNLAAANSAARSLALSGAETNKSMLTVLVEQATLEKVLNLIQKGSYAR